MLLTGTTYALQSREFSFKQRCVCSYLVFAHICQIACRKPNRIISTAVDFVYLANEAPSLIFGRFGCILNDSSIQQFLLYFSMTDI